jgi:Spy/CpxP family protein refolding chaperone
MNLKALFLALTLSLPFAAAATTVSSVASADPLPAAQAEKSAPEARHVGEGKRGEHRKGEHRRAEHRKGEHGKREHGKGRGHYRGGHGKKGPSPRENGPARPTQGPGKR